MKKIPSLFKYNEGFNSGYSTEVNDSCQWVIDGEGIATLKYDGTCCMFDGSRWYKRYTLRAKRQAPADFIQVDHDYNTGKSYGWVPVVESDKWHVEGIKWLNGNLSEFGLNARAGTYELCGPKVQGNPEGYSSHVLIRHAAAFILVDAPRSYDDLYKYLESFDGEGIVFHHSDGRMCKVTRAGFKLVNKNK